MTTFRLGIFVLAALVFAQINDWQPRDQVLVGAVALASLAFLWSRMSLRGVAVSRRIPSDRSQVGKAISDEITVENRSLFGKLWLEVRDHSTLQGHLASRVVNLGPRKRSSWRVETICGKRGR